MLSSYLTFSTLLALALSHSPANAPSHLNLRSLPQQHAVHKHRHLAASASTRERRRHQRLATRQDTAPTDPNAGLTPEQIAQRDTLAEIYNKFIRIPAAMEPTTPAGVDAVPASNFPSRETILGILSQMQAYYAALMAPASAPVASSPSPSIAAAVTSSAPIYVSTSSFVAPVTSTSTSSEVPTSASSIADVSSVQRALAAVSATTTFSPTPTPSLSPIVPSSTSSSSSSSSASSSSASSEPTLSPIAIQANVIPAAVTAAIHLDPQVQISVAGIVASIALPLPTLGEPAPVVVVTTTTVVPSPTAISSTSVSASSSSTSSSSTSSSSSSSSPSATARSPFSLTRSHAGSNFFDGWDFFTAPDPTHGQVNFLSQSVAQAKGLVSTTSSGATVMRVDNTTWLGSGQNRNSVRISSKETFGIGSMIIMDANKMPFGPSVWPAFWSVGSDWPHNGEIDIMEGVHDNVQNQYTLHTGPGCTLTTPMQAVGKPLSTNCDVFASGNTGCGVQDPSVNSYGSGWNAVGGGVFVMIWTTQGISNYMFNRDNIPADIASGSPVPAGWGQPRAFWSSNSCKMNQSFGAQTLVFDITICGDWAGATYSSAGYSGSCSSAVQNPSNYDNALFEVNSVKVYSLKDQ